MMNSGLGLKLKTHLYVRWHLMGTHLLLKKVSSDHVTLRVGRCGGFHFVVFSGFTVSPNSQMKVPVFCFSL